jgi:hypothetical protein
MTAYPQAGACFCGAVRYQLKRAPMFIHCCHCRDCQTQTGGAFALNALVERSELELEAGSAEPVAISMPTGSGNPHIIYRCAACQTALWSDYGGRGLSAFVRVSTLKNAHEYTPDVHIFTRSKVPWVSLPPGALAFEVYYDTEALWPPESLARRKALYAKG